MLLIQALERLFECQVTGTVSLFSEDTRFDLQMVIFDIAVRLLGSQNTDGSWQCPSSDTEITAYAVIALKHLARLPLTRQLAKYLNAAIQGGTAYLKQRQEQWTVGDYVWIEKVSYRSGALSEAYCLAALNGPENPAAVESYPSKMVGFAKFFSKISLFAHEPEWRLQASLAESFALRGYLESRKLDFFPREKMTKDDYLDYIPFTWVGINNKSGMALNSDTLREMMVVSMLNYQVDEYMETAIDEGVATDLASVRSMISRICTSGENRSSVRKRIVSELDGPDPSKRLKLDAGNDIPAGFCTEEPSASLKELGGPLQKFVTYVLTRPAVQGSSPTIKRQLRQALEAFLLAHVDQAEDNRRLAASKPPTSFRSHSGSGSGGSNAPPASLQPGTFSCARSSYRDWVRGTSALHTSCAYSFAFFACVVGACAVPSPRPVRAPRGHVQAVQRLRGRGARCGRGKRE